MLNKLRQRPFPLSNLFAQLNVGDKQISKTREHYWRTQVGTHSIAYILAAEDAVFKVTRPWGYPQQKQQGVEENTVCIPVPQFLALVVLGNCSFPTLVPQFPYL